MQEPPQNVVVAPAQVPEIFDAADYSASEGAQVAGSPGVSSFELRAIRPAQPSPLKITVTYDAESGGK